MLDTITDARGNVVEFDFDDLGRVSRIARQTALGPPAEMEIMRFHYGRPGDALLDAELRMPGEFLIEVESGETGTVSPVKRKFIYSSYGHLVEIRSPKVDGVGDPVTTANFWVDTDGNRVLSKDAGHGPGPSYQRTGFKYDSLGRLISIVDNAMEADEKPTGNQTSFEYDAFDNRTRVVNDTSGSRTTNFEYDWLDRLRFVRAPGETLAQGDVLTTEFRYDAMGNVAQVIEPDPGNGLARTTDYEYDSLSRLTAVQQPGGAAFRTIYEYDGRSRLYRVTNARGNVLDYAYFNWGGLAEVHQFEDLVAANVAPVDPAANRFVGYSYDKEGNLLSVAAVGPAGTGSAAEAFSPPGLLPIASGSVVAGDHLLDKRLYEFSYDALNRVESTTAYYLGEGTSGPIRTTLTNTFDSRGNRDGLTLTEADGDTLDHSWCYDDRDRVIGLLPPGVLTGDCGGPSAAANSYAFFYEPNDALESVLHSNGLSTSYLYQPHGPIMEILVDGSGVAAPVPDPLRLIYSIDELLNVTGIDEYRDTVLLAPTTPESTSYAYGYDQALRLTSAVYPDDPGNPGTPLLPEDSFTYDERGNRDNGVASDSTYNENNQLMTSPGATRLCYDGDGNLEKIQNGGPDCATGTVGPPVLDLF